MKKVYFSIILLLVSATTFAQENIESLLKQLCEDPVFAKQLSITEPSELQAFYKDNNFQPIWHANKTFQESFIEELRKAVQYGLNPQEYHFDYLIQPNVNQLEYELLCTHAMLSYFSDFTAGIKPKTLAFNGIEYQNQPVNTPQILHQNIKYGSFSKLLEKYEVKNQHYKKVLETYQRLLNAPDSLFIPTKLTKTLVENKSLQQKLVFWKCIESLTIYDSEIILIEALKRFQEKFNLEADGKLGNNTLKVLNTNKFQLLNQLKYDLNYIRFLSAWNYPTYLWVNIPSAEFSMIEAQTKALSMRVIVGNPQTPTPSLMNTIKQCIFFPYWFVPSSIAIKEMLPQIQKDINYLSNNSIQVLDQKWNVLDETTLPWTSFNAKNFPYKLRQVAGCDNSLGIIKFDFDNPFMVYLHDTNAKKLFQKNNRWLSHGCIRLEKPTELAEKLLGNPSLIQKLVAQQHEPDLKPIYFQVQPNVPLLISYLCSGINEKGDLVFYSDVYQKVR